MDHDALDQNIAEKRVNGGAAAPARAGRVYWITGLSGAGKSSVARLLQARLREGGSNAVLLDGDDLRAAIGDDLGYGEADRRRSAGRNARLCKLLADQGLDVVCATISMFDEVRDWNRAEIENYVEIYLRVPAGELAARDTKGLHQVGARETYGVDVTIEEPKAPDLVIDHFGETGPEEAVDQIMALSDARGAA